MALTAYFTWESKDATQYWNLRYKDIFNRGIYYGGTVTPDASSLQVTISQFVAISDDGMVIREDDTSTAAVLESGEELYICVWARYRLNDPPILSWNIYTKEAYENHSEKSNLIVFCRVVVPTGATGITTAMIHYDVRDVPANDSKMREPVEDYDDLPQGVVDGELCMVVNENKLYRFINDGTSGGSWAALLGYAELVSAQHHEHIIDLYRKQGSGVIRSGKTANQLSEYDRHELYFHDHATYNYRVGIGEISAIVGGHYIKTKHLDYDLPAGPDPDIGPIVVETVGDLWFEVSVAPDPMFTVGKRVSFDSDSEYSYRIAAISGSRVYIEPVTHAHGAGLSPNIKAGDQVWQEKDRYDIIYLEVWREQITTPELAKFSHTDGGTYTVDQVRAALEANKDYAGEEGENFDFCAIEFGENGDIILTKYQLSHTRNENFAPKHLADVRMLVNDTSILGDRPSNDDGNKYKQTYHPEYSTTTHQMRDETVWVSTNTGAYDGYSWAIPICAVKRRSYENISGGIQRERETGNVYITPLYSTIMLGNEHIAAKANSDLILKNDNEEAVCGFLSGFDSELFLADYEKLTSEIVDHGFKLPPCTLQAAYEKFKFDTAQTIYAGHPVASGSNTVLVMAELTYSRAPHQGTTLGKPMLVKKEDGRIAPYWPTLEFRSYPSTYQVVNPMDAIGGIAGFDKIESVYKKVLADADLDNRDTYLSTIWAVPIILAHRRNTGDFSVASESGWSGSVGRPDYHKFGMDVSSSSDTSSLIHADDVLDLRQAIINQGEAEGYMERTLELLTCGKLRTRFFAHPSVTGHKGTRVLDMNFISDDPIGAGLTGADAIGSIEGTSVVDQNMRGIWSEGKEVYPITVTFATDISNANQPEPGSEYVEFIPDAYNAGEHQLTIKAPAGAYIVTETKTITPWDTDTAESGESAPAGYGGAMGGWIADVPGALLAFTNAKIPIMRHYEGANERNRLVVFDSSAYAAIGDTHNQVQNSGTYTNTIRDHMWTTAMGGSIVSSDDNSNPTEMKVRAYDLVAHPTLGKYNGFWIDTAANRECTVTFYVCFDRSRTDERYTSNRGLRFLPEEVEEVELYSQAGATETLVHKMAPQMLVAELTKETTDNGTTTTLADGDSVSVTFTAADIVAYLNRTGTYANTPKRFKIPRGVSIGQADIQIYGLSPLKTPPTGANIGESRIHVAVGRTRQSELPLDLTEYDAEFYMNEDQDELTVEITNQTGRPLTQGGARTGGRDLVGGLRITVLVHFDHRKSSVSDTNNLYDWIDVTKPNKGVRAKFEYAQLEEEHPPNLLNKYGNWYPIGNHFPGSTGVEHSCAQLLEQVLAAWVWDSTNSRWKWQTGQVTIPAEGSISDGEPWRAQRYDMEGGIFLQGGLFGAYVDDNSIIPWNDRKVLLTYIKQVPPVNNGTTKDIIRIWYKAEPYQGIYEDLPTPNYDMFSHDEDDDTYVHTAPVTGALFGSGRILSASPVVVTTAGSGATYLDPTFAIAGSAQKSPIPRLNEYLQPEGAPNETPKVTGSWVIDGNTYTNVWSALFAALAGGYSWTTVLESNESFHILMKEYPSVYRQTSQYARRNCLDFWNFRKAGSILRLPFHDPNNTPFMDALGQTLTDTPHNDKIQTYDTYNQISEWDLAGERIEDYGDNYNFGDMIFVPKSPAENSGRYPSAGLVSSLFAWLAKSASEDDYRAVINSIFDAQNRGFCIARRHIRPDIVQEFSFSWDIPDWLAILLGMATPATLSYYYTFISRPTVILCPGVTPMPFGNMRDYLISARQGSGVAGLGGGKDMPEFTMTEGIRIDMDKFYSFVAYAYQPWMPFRSMDETYLTPYDWWSMSDVWMGISGNPQMRIDVTEDGNTYKGNTDIAKPGGVWDCYVPVNRPILKRSDCQQVKDFVNNNWSDHEILD